MSRFNLRIRLRDWLNAPSEAERECIQVQIRMLEQAEHEQIQPSTQAVRTRQRIEAGYQATLHYPFDEAALSAARRQCVEHTDFEQRLQKSRQALARDMEKVEDSLRQAGGITAALVDIHQLKSTLGAKILDGQGRGFPQDSAAPIPSKPHPAWHGRLAARLRVLKQGAGR